MEKKTLQNEKKYMNKKKTQIIDVRNERSIYTDLTDIRKMIRKYHTQLCANKSEDLNEIEKFIEKYKV